MEVSKVAISFSGFSGIDTESLIEKMMYLNRAPIRRLEDDKEDINSKIDAWQSVNSGLDTMKKKVSSMENSFGQMSISSSDEEVITATAENEALAASYNMEVTQLAKYHTLASSAEVTNDSMTGSFDITFDDGTADPHSVTINVENADVNNVAEAINNSTIDHDGDSETDEVNVATASVVDGKLVIKASQDLMVNDNSVNNTLQLSGGLLTDLNLDNAQELQTPQLAQFSVDGMDITRTKNDGIDDVIDGVTLNLLSKGTSTLQAATDTEAIKEGVNAFVDQYNAVQDKIINYGGIGEGETGELQGDSTLQNIDSSLYRSVVQPVNSLTSKEFIGTSTSQPLSADGTLEIGIEDYSGSTVETQSINLTSDMTLEEIVSAIDSSSSKLSAEIRDGKLAISTSKGGLNLSSSSTSVLSDLEMPKNLDVSTLSSVGIEVDRNGKLTVDETKLDEALATDKEDVSQLMDTIVYRVEKQVDLATDSYDGYLSSRLDTLNGEIENINEEIDGLEDRMEMKKTRLQSKFTQMEQLISSLESQQSWLSGQTESMGL